MYRNHHGGQPAYKVGGEPAVAERRPLRALRPGRLSVDPKFQALVRNVLVHFGVTPAR
jgi:hypothetical protein